MVDVATAQLPVPTDADVALLWAGASVTPDTQRIAEAARSARIDYVFDVAARQRVAPLVLRSLRLAGVDPDALVGDAVAKARLREAHATLAVPAAAAAVIEPLNAAGLKPMVLKGLALVGRYPAPGLRPMDDIDLLLPRDLIGHALNALVGAGWERMSHLDPDPGYDIALRHTSAPGVPLELHYELARWQERTSGIGAKRLWASRTPIEVFGHTVWGLPSELELISLIAHASKRFHLFSRLLWVVDFTIVAEEPGLDWENVARVATEARLRVPVAIGLRLARRMGAAVPDELLQLPPFLARSGALSSLLDPMRPFVIRGSPRWLAYVLVDGVAGKVRLAAGDVVRPPRGEPRRKVIASIGRALQRVVPLAVRAGFRPRRGA